MRNVALCLLASLSLCLPACGGGEAADAGPDTGARADAGPRSDAGPRDTGPAPIDLGPQADTGPVACTGPCAVVELALGGGHTCARRASGEVWCWGRGEEKQLGIGPEPRANCTPGGGSPTSCSPEPVQVNGLFDAVQLGIHDGAGSCARSTANGVVCWGFDPAPAQGQTSPEIPMPTPTAGSAGATYVIAGDGLECILVGGGVKCRGANYAAQLGAGISLDRPSPAYLDVVDFITTIPVDGDAGAPDAGALVDASSDTGAADADVDAGAVDAGPLDAGLGDAGPVDAGPDAGPRPPLRNVRAVSIASGGATACAVLTDGRVVCWGNARQGQFGDGRNDHGRCGSGQNARDCSPVPVLVPGLTGVERIEGGFNHLCALKTDRTVWCWGGNSAGQLGDGTTEQRQRPIQVPGITDAIDLSAGDFNTCVLRATGRVQCWGRNDRFQLGDGRATHTNCTDGTQFDCSLTPVEVMGPTDATRLWTGGAHSCVITPTTGVWCWGLNRTLQLGDPTTDAQGQPVQRMTPYNIPQFRP